MTSLCFTYWLLVDEKPRMLSRLYYQQIVIKINIDNIVKLTDFSLRKSGDHTIAQSVKINDLKKCIVKSNWWHFMSDTWTYIDILQLHAHCYVKMLKTKMTAFGKMKQCLHKVTICRNSTGGNVCQLVVNKMLRSIIYKCAHFGFIRTKQHLTYVNTHTYTQIHMLKFNGYNGRIRAWFVLRVSI